MGRERRQLARAIEGAVACAASEIVPQVQQRHVFPVALGGDGKRSVTFQEATRAFQSGFVRDVLEESGWNVSEAAARMDVARSHVYNLIRAFGIVRGGGERLGSPVKPSI